MDNINIDVNNEIVDDNRFEVPTDETKMLRKEESGYQENILTLSNLNITNDIELRLK